MPDSALLLEDTSGTGHRSRVLGSQPAVLAVVHVQDRFGMVAGNQGVMN